MEIKAEWVEKVKNILYNQHSIEVSDSGNRQTWACLSINQVNEAANQILYEVAPLIAQVEGERIANFIENLPTDGHDKWYYYHRELAESIRQSLSREEQK